MIERWRKEKWER